MNPPHPGSLREVVPTPYTFNPKFLSLHLKLRPYTLSHKPHTLVPTPETSIPRPFNLNLTPETLQPEPLTPIT
jgi:hypothetical protein